MRRPPALDIKVAFRHSVGAVIPLEGKPMLSLVGYIDAGSGSYLLAAIASGAAGLWFFVRTKFSSLTGRGKSTGTAETAAPDAEQ